MSHELRTPLNAIIGFSDLLHSDEFDAFAEKRRIEYAGHIHSAGRHLLTLVNDALDLSAVGAAPMTLRSEEHTSELQSLMRISYAVFCLKKTKVISQST